MILINLFSKLICPISSPMKNIITHIKDLEIFRTQVFKRKRNFTKILINRKLLKPFINGKIINYKK